MQLQYKDYGFYKIDINYLKYLHAIDDQVFYKEEKNYDRKPHLGMLVGINGFKYCIPLTSAKPRHLGWQNITEHNYIVYEIVKEDELHKGDIYKKYDKESKTYKKLLSVLEIRKMIPVNEQVIEKIIFDDIEDQNYRNLLLKEYRSLSSYKRQILLKAQELYDKQKETSIVKSCYVTFNRIEKAYNDRFNQDATE